LAQVISSIFEPPSVQKMAEVPKINASPIVGHALSMGCKGYRVLSQTLGKHNLGDLSSKICEHTLVKQALDRQEILFICLGVALTLHGSHFKNLFLCTQVVMIFLLERVRTKVMASWKDITVAQEKLQADEDKSKNAKKDDLAAEIASARKALKTLDSEKLTSAGVEVLLSVMACVLVMQGGLAQKVAITYFIVGLVADKIEGILVFPEHEDIQAWTHMMCRFLLWAFMLPVALLFGPMALCINASVCGARIVAERGGLGLAKIAPDSQQGLLITCALAGFGTLWQLWSYTAGGGVAWYFQMLYLPAVLVEGALGLL